MTSIFISYSREDIVFARKVVTELTGNKFDTWVDWDSIPKGEYWEPEIYKGIEAAEILVFLMSPNSAKSEMCNKEIIYATKNNKRIIPIVIREAAPKEFLFEDAAKEISRRNWIFCRHEGITEAVQEAIKTIFTDYEWLKFHTKLQLRALEWERNSYEKSLFLHGKELENAEIQLATNSSKEPSPTELQHKYVLKSRQAASKQRRTTTSIATVGVVALAILSIFAFMQAGLARSAEAKAISNQGTAQAASTLALSNAGTAQANFDEAKKQAQKALAGKLSALSVSIRDTKFDLSLLLSVEAFRIADTPESRGSLITAYAYNPSLVRYLQSEPAYSLAYNPNGNMLAIGRKDNTIAVWDLSSGNLFTILEGHLGAVTSVAFSPKGDVLASGSADQTIRLWDIFAKKSSSHVIEDHRGTITALAFSPDGIVLASASTDTTIRLWNASGDPLNKTLFHTTSVSDLCFDPNGKYLASSDASGAIYLWDTTEFQKIGEIATSSQQSSRTDDIASLACSPDGKTLASGNWRAINLWDVTTRSKIGESLAGHTDWIFSLNFSHNGKYLASGGDDSMIFVWDLESDPMVGQPLVGHTDSIWDISFSPDDKFLSSGSGDGRTAIWSTDFLTHAVGGIPLIGHTAEVLSVALAPDGRTLASAGRDNTIRLWDVRNHVALGKPLEGHSAAIHSIVFSPDGKLIISGSDDNTIRIWNVQNQALEQTLVGPAPIWSVAINPVSRMLASSGSDAKIQIWNIDTGQEIAKLQGHNDIVWTLAFSPDGKTLASGGRDNIIMLWDLTTNPITGHMLTGHTSFVWSVAFSPDGKTLVSSSTDKTMRFWDVSTKQWTGDSLSGHTTAIVSVNYSRDGKLLVSSSRGEIILWDTENLLPISSPIEVSGSANWVRQVEFEMDNKAFVSGSDDSIVRFWPLDPYLLTQFACERAGRNLTRLEWSQYIGETLPYQAVCPNLPIEVAPGIKP
jgi:WD40 repeat protein